jgi:spore germination protein YaaH
VQVHLNESSSGCVKHWDDVAGSPYLDCRIGQAHSQTWYDDARSTALKVALARRLGLRGVGVFTGEAVGSGHAAQQMWNALSGVTSSVR